MLSEKYRGIFLHFCDFLVIVSFLKSAIYYDFFSHSK